MDVSRAVRRRLAAVGVVWWTVASAGFAWLRFDPAVESLLRRWFLRIRLRGANYPWPGPGFAGYANYHLPYDVTAPVGEQYVSFLLAAALGDVGRSVRTTRPVGAVLAPAVPWVLAWAALAVALGWGVSAAARFAPVVTPGSRRDRALAGATCAVAYAVPVAVSAVAPVGPLTPDLLPSPLARDPTVTVGLILSTAVVGAAAVAGLDAAVVWSARDADPTDRVRLRPAARR